MSSPETSDGILTLGLLDLGGETIAVNVDALAEVAHIDVLKPTLEPQAGVLGLISIRGSLIPVCDPFSVYNSANKTSPAIAAVIISEDQAIGLAVDGVQGLRRFNRNDVQYMHGSGNPGFGAGTIQREDGFIEVIDADALIQNSGLPHAKTRLRKAHGTGRTTTRPYLTFEAGGVFFAVPARTIFGTVPRQAIEDATLSDGTYLGTITYFRRRVPVMDTNRVFALGTARQVQSSETVVLRLPEDRLLGFAVHRICHVALPAQENFRRLPLQIDSQMGLLFGTVDIDGVEHFLINEEKLMSDPQLGHAAELSEQQSSKVQPLSDDQKLAAAHGANKIEKLRDRFLLIDAGAPIALRMRDLRGMREPPKPEDVTPCASYAPGLEGLFFVDGQLVPLINLATYLGTGAGEKSLRVLLVQHNGFVAGFLLEDVQGVATSRWFSRQDDRLSSEFDLVAIRRNGETEVFNYLDIQALTGRIAESWAVPA